MPALLCRIGCSGPPNLLKTTAELPAKNLAVTSRASSLEYASPDPNYLIDCFSPCDEPGKFGPNRNYMSANRVRPSTAHFLNVDLDCYLHAVTSANNCNIPFADLLKGGECIMGKGGKGTERCPWNLLKRRDLAVWCLPADESGLGRSRRRLPARKFNLQDQRMASGCILSLLKNPKKKIRFKEDLCGSSFSGERS